MIAALYVETGGVYFGLPDVDPWDLERDARTYAGPHPVVAHPPCKRWGRYWYGGPSVKVRKTLGDDGGCFAAAVEAVDLFGGVLEHPEASHAWHAHGIRKPPKRGGWVPAGLYRPGWTCCVEQGHYGHRSRKATWLYAHRIERPALLWGLSGATVRLEPGFHTKEEARAARSRPDYAPVERLSRRERMDTPLPFRDLLLSMARSVT